MAVNAVRVSYREQQPKKNLHLPPPEPLELVCEFFHSRISVPWLDDVPEIEVG